MSLDTTENYPQEATASYLEPVSSPIAWILASFYKPLFSDIPYELPITYVCMHRQKSPNSYLGEEDLRWNVTLAILPNC